MDLQSLLTQPEGKTLEFKRDLSSPRHILRTVVAFANSAGGSIVVGIEDGSRDVRGVEHPLDDEERLANVLSDGIAPRLAPDIEIVAWRSLQLLVVTVYPGPSKPYHVKADGPRDGVYVRIGSANRRADAALSAELARTARGESFDEQPFPDEGTRGLDLPRIAALFEGVRPIRERDLTTLRLATTHQARKVATVGGVLLFGIARQDHFPDAGIWAARFKGLDRRTIIDSKEFAAASIPDQVDLAMEFVQRHVMRRLEIAGTRHEVWWEYPIVAVREAVTNAVVHADYSQTGSPIRLSVYDDRIEIENPGNLVPGLTIPDIIGGVSKLRNRVIARVFRELGLIEQWGSGIARMTAACREAGLPDPLLEELSTRFRVTLFNSRDARSELDAVDREIVESLRQGEGLSTQELAQRVNRTTRAVRTRLGRLVESGVIVEVGSGPHDPRRQYFVAEDRARYGR